MSAKKRGEDGAKPPERIKPITLKQLAGHLNLSPATVSLVLNRSPVADSIPKETHERVFAAAKKLDYRPNLVARSLRSRRSFSIGVLVPEVSEGYATGVLSGIEDHLMEEGYFYLVASHRSRPDLLEEYAQMLRDRLVEGFILVNTPISQPPGLPTVAIAGHESLPGVTNVVIDHGLAAHLALHHLTEQGHREIAFFKGHAHSADTEDRWQGILAAAPELGIEVRPELALQLGGDAVEQSFSPEQIYEEGYAFGRRLLEAGREFTALFAFNDASAIGAMRAFLEAGRRVPQDISVVGFDDIQGAGFQNPGLTTVRQPLREMGKTAGRILLERLAGNGSSPPLVSVEPGLVVRGSTGPAPSMPVQRARRGRRGGA